MQRYARFFRSHRRAVLGFVLCVTLLAIVGGARLRFDDVPRGIFSSEEESYTHLLELYADFGADDNDVLLVLEADDWLQVEGVRRLRSIESSCRELDGVASVFGLPDVPVFSSGLPGLLLTEQAATKDGAAFARRVHAHPLVRDRLLSSDGRTTLFLARLEGEALSVGEMKPVVEGLRQIAAAASSVAGVRVRVTGVPPVRVDIYETIRREQILFLTVGALLCSAVSWLLFGSLGAVIAATVGPLLGTFWAFGLIGLQGGSIDILGATLPLICIVIGFTDSVHLVSHARDRLRAGAGRLEAAVDALRALGGPCFLTSLTTAVGFGSLAVGNVPAIRRFGMQASFAVICCFLAVITTLPLLVAWLSTERRSSKRPSANAAPASPSAGHDVEHVWGRLAGWTDLVTRRSRTFSALGIFLTVGLLALSARLVPENRLMEATVPETDAYQALAHCEEVFGGVLPAYVRIEWNEESGLDDPRLLQALQAVHRSVENLERVAPAISALSLLQLFPELPDTLAPLSVVPDEILHGFLREDLSRLAVVFGVPDGGTDTMERIYGRLQGELEGLEAEYPELSFVLTGTDVVARESINTMIVDLAKSLFFAALIILVVIAFEFRSASLGVVSLLPNLFPLAVTGSVLVLSGRPLQMSSAVIFSVLLGLAVDDTIHMLASYRRELAGLPSRGFEDVRRALRRSVVTVGRAVGMTTIVLFLGFAVGFSSAIPLNRVVSGLLCLGIVAAFVGDLVFLPALLALRARLRSGPSRGQAGADS